MSPKPATATKPAAKPVLPLLTGPKAVGGKGKTPMAEVMGLETVVDSYLKTAAEIESLEAELETMKLEIRPQAETERLVLEKQTGQCIKSIMVHGTDRPMRVSFSDRFKKISVDHEVALRGALGAAFDSIIRRTDDIKPKAGVTAEKLRELLGDKLEQLFEITPQLEIVKMGMEARAKLRPVLSDDVNEVVDGVISQVQYSPSFNTK